MPATGIYRAIRRARSLAAHKREHRNFAAAAALDELAEELAREIDRIDTDELKIVRCPNCDHPVQVTHPRAGKTTHPHGRVRRRTPV